MLHALRPRPAGDRSRFTLAIDFEGDQWTFFKPPHGELARALRHRRAGAERLAAAAPSTRGAHLARGKLIITEADAYWLPDTAGTDYRTQHTKTTIVIHDIDLEGERVGYFHNAGYFELEGDDFRGLFGLDAPAEPARLPLYCEFVRLESLRLLTAEALREVALDCTRAHVRRRPRENPVARFATSFPETVAGLGPDALPTYHRYAFSSVRQLGAAAELGAHHLRWLQPAVSAPLEGAVAALDSVSLAAKSLILKGARAVSTGKRSDFAPLLSSMSAGWRTALDATGAALGL